MSRKNHFRRSTSLLPTNRGRRLALFNGDALVPMSRVFILMRDKQLAATLRDSEPAKKLRTQRPLLAFDMLEEGGLHLGLTPEELAERHEFTVEAARNAMNRAEYLIWEVFGLTISFFGFGKPWRMLNHVEVALKHAQITKGNATKQKRAVMYETMARHHGKSKGTLQAPLFDFDFKSLEEYAAQR